MTKDLYYVFIGGLGIVELFMTAMFYNISENGYYGSFEIVGMIIFGTIIFTAIGLLERYGVAKYDDHVHGIDFSAKDVFVILMTIIVGFNLIGIVYFLVVTLLQL